ncbi:MAG: carbohydrate-binding protein [Planctomycetota bacterium]
MNSSLSYSIGMCLSVAFALLFCSSSQADDVTWTGQVSSAWENGSNWDNGSGPQETDYVYISSGTVDHTSTSGNSPALRGFRQSGGVLNISGGQLNVAQLASAFSNLNASVVQTGGIAIINSVHIGSETGANGDYLISGGELRISRGNNGHSLYLGGHKNNTNAGVGSLTISGGTFTTRDDVKLGDASAAGTGVFTILGAGGDLIGIGSANDDIDGSWHQYSGSSLVVRFEGIAGCTPIFIKDNTDPSGTSATFENGALLNVDHLNSSGGGTWTVMEVENGSIIDNGLVFAPGVDTNIWSFTVDNSGPNGKLVVSAAGDPVGYDLIVGNVRQQRMRYGMDYERLWYWTGGLNSAERDLVAKWSAIDTRIDYVRVAINCAYELDEGNYNLSAYTSKIIPLMQEMQEANPDIKFFASPRPLNEAISGAAWQPYPRWITGDPGNGNFNFDWQKCAEYLECYILLMKSYGFKISFLDVTNEWQNPGGSGRITTGDVRDIAEYLETNLDPDDMPLIIAPSAWNYSQGANWVNDLWTSRRREAVDIAACHNTSRTGSAQQFADAVASVLGPGTEIWNTEVHGWKSTSGENEVTSFYYYLEKIRAGFSGLNGWLAIGTTNQGHCYILNPSGTPRRNVKYFIFKKLSSTSNYGNALNIVEEPAQLSHTAALIKGNLMTVWVINQGASAVPVTVTPAGRTISESTVKRTRWTDPADVEGFVTFEPVNTNTSFFSSIPGESVCCFEILLDPGTFPYSVIEAENEDERNGMFEEPCGDAGGTLNLGNINNGAWSRYNGVEFSEDASMRFRVARPPGRPDGWVEVYLGSAGDATATILANAPVGKVAVPETGDWQNYETIEACLESTSGT